MVDLDAQYKYSPVRTIIYTINNLLVSVYPNPVSQAFITVSASVNCTRIDLMDISGRFIRGQNVYGLQNVFSVSGLAKRSLPAAHSNGTGIENRKK